jgi:4-amino-4-deoxy-L-arabinose transferase-like glycosyltransferase
MLLAESRIWRFLADQELSKAARELPNRTIGDLASNDVAVLALWAAAGVLLHIVTDGQYGFHRDELATLDDARSLAWGYVAYPPVTPFLARVAFILFGPSLIGLRFFAAMALGLVMVLTGLMARRLGAGRQAQVVAALAAVIGGVAFSGGTLLQYVSFDYLWWVAAAYFMVRLLASNDPRWCLAVAAMIGLGMLTKYTIIFLVVGIAASLLFTSARLVSDLSPWRFKSEQLQVPKAQYWVPK